MDSNHVPLNYQRAVTPRLASNYSTNISSSKVTTVNSQQTQSKRPLSGRNAVNSTHFSPTGGDLAPSRTFISLNGGQLPMSNIPTSMSPSSSGKVLQRGMIMSGHAPMSPPSELNLQGRALSSQTSLKAPISSAFIEDSNRQTTPSEEKISDGIIFSRLFHWPDTLIVHRTEEV